MRSLLVVGSVLVVIACGRAGVRADTAAAREPVVVAGPPAVPAALPPDRGAPTARTDSLRGTVSVVGTSFDQQVMIAEQGSQRRVEVIGALSGLIGHVAGAEVSVAGVLAGSRIEATGFLVRSVDGQPAIDGTLRTDGGLLFIVTASGVRTRIVAPPPPLVGQDGARVWITGDPAKGVSMFGFIDPPR